MESNPKESLALRQHGDVEDQRPDDDTRPEFLECLKSALDWCKEQYGYIKTSALGILIIQRWLPIQDYGSDSLVTFCPDNPSSVLSVLCSNTGLWWTEDWWWGHLSASFIILPYALLWISSTPVLMNLAASEDHHTWLSAVISLTWTYSFCGSVLSVLFFDWSTLACKLGLLMSWFGALLFGLIATRLIGPGRGPRVGWLVVLFVLGGEAYLISMLYHVSDWLGKSCIAIFAFVPLLVFAGALYFFHSSLCANLRRGIFITWVCFGAPVVFLLDFIMILAFPLKNPPHPWLRNIGRLRCVLESLIESPTQCPLQARIAVYRFLHRGARFPWTLLVSIGTSLLSVTLTLLDLRADAKALNISTIEVVCDLLLVGLQRRAPLIHLLRVSESIDYAPEGRLQSNHITEILSVCGACGGLRELRFGNDSGLGIGHIKDIVPLIAKLSIVDVPGLLTFSDETVTIMAAVSEEHLEQLLPLTIKFVVVAEKLTIPAVEDLTIPAKNHFGPMGCAKLKSIKLSNLVIGDSNNIGPDGCDHLSSLADLKTLQIGKGNGIGHEGCAKLLRLSQLISLHIGDDNQIGQKGCDHLSSLAGLKTLQIGKGNGIGHEGCAKLLRLNKSTSLQIDVDNSIDYVGGLGKDNHLALANFKEILPLVTKFGFVEIGGALTFTQRKLTIMAAVSVEHVDILLPFTEQFDVVVEDLTIPAKHDFGPEGCAKLKPLKLRKLVISEENKIGLLGCDHLGTFVDLTSLVIDSENQVGHEGCNRLMKLNKLKRLKIGPKNSITQKAKDDLTSKKLGVLAHLDISVD